MYTTAWGIIFFGMPATPIVMLLFVAKHQMSWSGATNATGGMLICEVAIAAPLIFSAKWLSRSSASKWWEFWRV
ncbi:hypothetical protein [Nevskia soli]|uniref:hypothetical protein n=1 Tax=Nevskia soli TaxID=418856 RepID=UPI0012FB4B9D|nr:hypothetical protein [Nevskia soli]